MGAKGGEVVKAITLHQPWASLIAIGAKEYETRSWTHGYRGQLAIHAGKTLGVTPEGWIQDWVQPLGIQDVTTLPMGAVLCVCELTAIYRTAELLPHLSMQEKVFGNFQPGRFAWRMKVVGVFDPPIPARGKQGLWDWQKP